MSDEHPCLDFSLKDILPEENFENQLRTWHLKFS